MSFIPPLAGLTLLLLSPPVFGDEPAFAVGEEICCGYSVSGTEVHSEFQRILLTDGQYTTQVEIGVRRPGSDLTSVYYQVQPAPGASPPLELLLEFVSRLKMMEKTPGYLPFVADAGRTAPDPPPVIPANSDPIERTWQAGNREVAWCYDRKHQESLSFSGPTKFLMLLLVGGLLLLFSSWRLIAKQMRKIDRSHWIAMAACVCVGLVPRLIDGIRVPGFVSGHGLGSGFNTLRDVLIGAPDALSVHGNAYRALYGLLTMVLPGDEATVIGVQVLLSLLCIPLTYALARFLLRDGKAALWATLVVALMPIGAYFAATEVKFVPGAFFGLLSLAILELGLRENRLLPLLSAVLLLVFATQFHPLLMVLPVVALGLVATTGNVLSYMKNWRVWVAFCLFLILWGVCVGILYSVMDWTGSSIIGPGFVDSLAWPHEAFLPGIEWTPNGKVNAFLHLALTPLVFPLLALIGVLSLMLRRRWLVFGVLAAAFLLSWPGMAPGRLNLGRLQLAAQPFWAILAGAGAAFLIARCRLSVPRSRGWVEAVLCLILGTSVILWPGPLVMVPTPRAERRLMLEALPKLERGCSVVWAPMDPGVNWSVPTYLPHVNDAGLFFGGMRTPRVSGDLLDMLGCAYYLRTSYCYSVRHGEQATGPLRASCVQTERSIQLEAAQVKTVPSVPDGMIEYSRANQELGFFRILGVREPNQTREP